MESFLWLFLVRLALSQLVAGVAAVFVVVCFDTPLDVERQSGDSVAERESVSPE